jgi:hypothetical protein
VSPSGLASSFLAAEPIAAGLRASRAGMVEIHVWERLRNRSPSSRMPAVPPVPHADTPPLTVDTAPANPRALLPRSGHEALSADPL